MQLKAFLAAAFVCGLAVADPETLPVKEFAGEHRSAKPEPFIDRLVSLFSGDSSKKDKTGKLPPPGPRPGPVYQHRPPPGLKPYGPPPPAGRPVRNPRPPPPVAPASKPGNGPPTRYQPQPSNNFPTYVTPGGSLFNSAPPPSQPQTFNAPPPPQPQTPNDPWQIGQPVNMAQIKDLQVQCEKDMMRVRVIFDRPFYGMIFSKGHYRNANCVHVPANLGQTQATFDIALQSCGMTASGSQGYSQQTPQGSYIENTIIIQYDPQLQEVWDQARRLRCTWYDFYEKAVTFKPYQVDMLDPVTANFLGDNLRCWMQIQVGKGPQASEVSGIVKIGQTMTMVIGVKDDENKFDMMVRNCVAHDGSRAPIQLVDEKGCVPKERQKIMSPFKKVKNFDTTANVLSYAYFQAFKFPDSMNVHFQCVVQVCRGSCPDPQCGGIAVPPRSTAGSSASPAATSLGADSYGAPQAAPIGGGAPDSYGSPQGAPLGAYTASVAPPSGQSPVLPNPAINPRLPIGGNTVYSTDDSFTAPGFGEFKKRMGAAAPAAGEGRLRRGSILGGRPRSLEDDSDEVVDAKNALDEVRNALEMAEGDDNGHVERKSSRKRRSSFTSSVSLVDENGNRILSVHKREATEMADVETTEKVIQVIAPNDVQFHLPTVAESADQESGASSSSQQLGNNANSAKEVVINTNTSPAEAVCVDTTAFVCATVSFIMILVIALITIVFLWLRIRSLNNTKKAKTILQ